MGVSGTKACGEVGGIKRGRRARVRVRVRTLLGELPE